MIERMRVFLARWLCGVYGWSLVRSTPASLLSSRIEALAHRVRTSGHLAHRYHVRATLERDIAAVRDLAERLPGVAADRDPT